MKNKNRIISLFGLLLVALFLSIKSSFAAPIFQNNLLKANLIKNGSNNVKLVLYTSKPYKDPVFANPRNNNLEYVVLLPETANSITAKTNLFLVSDVVSSIDIKTHQYSNNLKGYTKITIIASKPITITSEVKTLNSSLKDSDYKELLNQKYQKANVKVQKQTVNPPLKTNSTKISQNSALKKIPAVSQATKSVIQTKTASPQGVKTLNKPQVKIPPKVSPSINVKQPVKQAQQKNVTVPAVTARVALQPMQKKSAKAPVKSPKNADNKAVVQEKKVATAQKPVQQKTQTVHPLKDKVSPKTNQNMTKTVTPQPQQINQELPSQTETASMPEPISTPETKTQLSKDIINPPMPETKVPQQNNIEKPSFVSQIISTGKKEVIKYKNMIHLNESSYNIIGGAFALLMLAFLVIRRGIKKRASGTRAETPTIQEPYQEQSYNESDLENVDESMNWQEKYQAFVGQEESFEPEFIEPVYDESEDENLEEQTVQGDEEVYQETQVELEYTGEEIPFDQAVYEQNEMPTIDENILSGSEYTPSDENFEDSFEQISEPEFEPEEFENVQVQEQYDEQITFDNNIAPTSDLLQEEQGADEDLEKIFGEDEEEFITEQQLPSEEIPIEGLQDTVLNEPLQVVEQPEEESEIVKSEFAIDDQNGFYLVDFEGSTALVGHLGQEFFVLKKFDETIDGRLQVRLDEKKGNKSTYMAKVGDFKGLVEITPQSMRLLIEL